MKRSLAIGIALLVLFGTPALILWQMPSQLTNSAAEATQASATLAKITLAQPKPLIAFRLLTQTELPFDQRNLLGRWTFMYFGYTQCPDVCPTTLNELNALSRLLQTELAPPDPIQYVFVSVDPQRDTAQQLQSYLAYFNSSFIGVTGAMNELNKLTKQLNVHHATLEGPRDTYTVDHSSAVFLIDPKGRFYAKFPAPHYAETLKTQFLAIAHNR